MDFSNAKLELEAVLNTLVDGVVIINGRGDMRLFNPASERIFGYRPDEVLGCNVDMLMPEPFHSAHDGYLAAYSATGEKKIIGIGREVQGRRKDGSVFPMDLAVGETRIDGAAVYIGIIRDLTRRYAQKQKYDQLQEEHFHLSRVAAMNEMGSAIAHELNQPLSASINYMETARLLLSRGDEALADRITQALSRSIEQTHRASDIIARMRGFIERGEVEKENCAIEDTVRTAVRLAFLSPDKQNIEMHLEFQNNLPNVQINNIQVQQVLVNLIKNAREAMAQSDRRRLNILAYVAACGTFVTVEVRDTGHGLTPEEQANLFVPFASNKSNGLGVGLSISQSIISHHGGQIWAQDNAEDGASFFFTLPVAQTSEKADR